MKNYDPQLICSLLFILVFYVLASIIRFTIRRLFPNPNNYNRILACDVCSTFERVAIAYELEIVLAGNGVVLYLMLLALIGVIFNLSWESTKSTFFSNIRRITQRKTTWDLMTIQLCTEFITGHLVYPLCTKPLWQQYDQHLIRWTKLHMQWPIDLQVGAGWGGLVEFTGCFICVFANMLLRESSNSKILNAIVSAVSSSVTVFFGLTLSGAYYDPILASIIQLGSNGISFFEHLVVYWIFPIVGGFCGYFTFKGVQSALGFKTDTKID